MVIDHEEIEIQLSFALGNPIVESLKARIVSLLLSSDKNKLAELFDLLNRLDATGKSSPVRINWQLIKKILDKHIEIQALRDEQLGMAKEAFHFNAMPNLARVKYLPFEALKGERRIKSNIGNEFETKIFAGYWPLFKKTAKEMYGRTRNEDLISFFKGVKKHNSELLVYLGLTSINKETLRQFEKSIHKRSKKHGFDVLRFLKESGAKI